MADAKHNVLNTVKKLPEDASYDDILDSILLQKKITEGIHQLDNGETISFDDFKKIVMDRLKGLSK